MKSVLISIHPKWCERIASGDKTVEVRKTRPRMETPFKCYIYCTRNARDSDKLWVLNKQRRQKYGGLTAVCANLAERPYHYEGNGKVIGEVVCDHIDEAHWEHITGYAGWNIGWTGNCCLSNDDLMTYAGNKTMIYGWHISDPKIYDEPKELSEFTIEDKEAIRQCEYRKQIYYAFTGDGYIKNGFYCNVDDDWCFGGCKRKALTRPPQSWCYVEELQ